MIYALTDELSVCADECQEMFEIYVNSAPIRVRGSSQRVLLSSLLSTFSSSDSLLNDRDPLYKGRTFRLRLVQVVLHLRNCLPTMPYEFLSTTTNPYPHVRFTNGSIIFPMVESIDSRRASKVTARQLVRFLDGIERDYPNEEYMLVLSEDYYITSTGEPKTILVACSSSMTDLVLCIGEVGKPQSILRNGVDGLPFKSNWSKQRLCKLESQLGINFEILFSFEQEVCSAARAPDTGLDFSSSSEIHRDLHRDRDMECCSHYDDSYE